METEDSKVHSFPKLPLLKDSESLLKVSFGRARYSTCLLLKGWTCHCHIGTTCRDDR